VAFTWLISLPIFVLNTLVGTSWLYEVVKETPQCVPTVSHLWFCSFWLVLCYVSVLVYVALGTAAWVIERRVRREERDLRDIQDDDILARWGEVSYVDRQSLSVWSSGLTPTEIRALSGEEVWLADAEEECCAECSICINALQTGDAVRHLPPCGHVFHRSCIDLWLLRRADCPLCKRDVRGEGSELMK
jgi:hypothetical protein